MNRLFKLNAKFQVKTEHHAIFQNFNRILLRVFISYGKNDRKLASRARKITDRLAQLLSAHYRCGRSWVRFPGRSNRHSVAKGLPLLRCFFGAVLPRR